MKKTPTYTIKKQKDGDYEVTLHNQTRVFSLKQVVLDYMDAQKALKETDSQRRLDRAVKQNIMDHHKDVIKMFEKLPKVKRAALTNYIQLADLIIKSDTRYKDAKRRHDRLKKELDSIYKVIPAEQKKLTKSEQRRLQAQAK